MRLPVVGVGELLAGVKIDFVVPKRVGHRDRDFLCHEEDKEEADGALVTGCYLLFAAVTCRHTGSAMRISRYICRYTCRYMLLHLQPDEDQADDSKAADREERHAVQHKDQRVARRRERNEQPARHRSARGVRFHVPL